MKTLVVIADSLKPAVKKAVDEMGPWLQDKFEVLGFFDTPQKLSSCWPQKIPSCVLVFGGDGFLLSTARELQGRNIPIMGVNFGKLGFLAEITIKELQETLVQISNDNCQVSERMMLQCEIIRDHKVIHTSLAVNDGVITSSQAKRMLFCGLQIGGEEVATYGGDGVIISTPVGSTAYSLSAGGPILVPSLSALVITPICPHTLTMRPLVIPSSQSVEIKFRLPYPGEATFTMDGQISFDLQQQDLVRVSKAKQSFYLLETGRRSYFRILREKLAWGESRNIQS